MPGCTSGSRFICISPASHAALCAVQRCPAAAPACLPHKPLLPSAVIAAAQQSERQAQHQSQKHTLCHNSRSTAMATAVAMRRAQQLPKCQKQHRSMRAQETSAGCTADVARQSNMRTCRTGPAETFHWLHALLHHQLAPTISKPRVPTSFQQLALPPACCMLPAADRSHLVDAVRQSYS